jgi:hypothetical protein
VQTNDPATNVFKANFDRVAALVKQAKPAGAAEAKK